MATSDINTTIDNKVFRVQTDAVPEDSEEDDQTNYNDEDHLQDNNMFSKKTRIQQEATASGHTEATSQSHGNNFNEHGKYFPQHLREDYNIDLLVIHTEADYEDAKVFKDCIEKNVKFCEDLTPHVALLDDVIADFRFRQLDDAFSRSVYILLYVTEQFCVDFGKLSESYTCLLKAFNSPQDRKAIIPVHTCSKQSRKFHLPMMLENLRPLNYFHKTFTQDVIKLLEHRSDLILERKYKLEMARQKYFEANKDELSKKQSMLEKSFKSSVNNSGTKRRDKESAPLIGDRAKESMKHTDFQPHPQSQFSVSTKPKCVVSSGNIESDGDVSERRMNRQQNGQQRNSMSHPSLTNPKDIVDNESGYNSLAGEESTRMNYSSHSESAGDKAQFTDLPTQLHRTNTPAAFSAKQNLSNAAGCDEPLPKVQSVPLEANENNEDPSTDDKHARKNTSHKMGPNAPAPVYHIHINHADFVSIDSIVDMIRKNNNIDTSDE